ncbi:MAG: DUF2726 domain-containing protein [archaeon]|nr:DUF2726 domain-containing protein [archaeon]
MMRHESPNTESEIGEKMEKYYIIFFSLFIVIIILKEFSKIKLKKKDNSSYKKIDLLTPTEKKFYFQLKEILPAGKILFCKIRIADILKPINKNKKNWFTSFNSISRKHFDFVVTDEKLKILYIIELNDNSHLQKKSKNSDEIKKKVCKSAGLELFFIPVQNNYINYLKDLLKH